MPSSESIDRLARWNDRWENNQLGWHETNVHEALLKYDEQLFPANDASCTENSRVLVSLCGKTVDMAYLAKHPAVAHVVGVDGVRKALDEFSDEHPDLNINPVSRESSVLQRLNGEKITLIQGDFFVLDESSTDGRFDVILDRASLVAIDPSSREKYVETMGRLMAPGGKMLLIVIERRSGTVADKNGPPFSVPETEVRCLYESQDWVESITLLEDNGEKARNEGSTMVSLYFMIQAKK